MRLLWKALILITIVKNCKDLLDAVARVGGGDLGELMLHGNDEVRVDADVGDRAAGPAGGLMHACLDDVPRSALSYQHAYDVLGWEPRVSIVEGVVKTVDYFRTTQQLH